MPISQPATILAAVSAMLAPGLWITVHAAPLQTNAIDNTSETAFPASKDDLIDQNSPSFLRQEVSGYSPFGNSDTAALNDGVTGLASENPGTTFDPDGSWTSTFILDISTNKLGYDIGSIRTIAGWIGNRSNQTFSLSFARFDDTTTFHPLGNFTFSPSANDTATGSSTQITLAGSDGGILAENVAALRFTFAPDTGNGTVYREIDAFGDPSHAIAPAPPKLVRIMPLGDSITAGLNMVKDVPGGYRKELSARLTSAGIPFDFVGSSVANPIEGTDPDHEGHGGFRTQAILENLSEWLSADPDVVLLHIGTNDVLAGVPLREITDNLEKILSSLVENKPDRVIFISSIIPVTQDFDYGNGLLKEPDLETVVKSYNRKVEAIVDQHAARGEKAIFVDMHGLVKLRGPDGKPNTTDDFYQPGDGIHPAQVGYDSMGDILAEALLPALMKP